MLVLRRLWVTAAALALACTGAKPAEPAASREPVLPASVDLGGVMQRVHFAFRPAADGFEASHRVHRARAAADGTVRVEALASQDRVSAPLELRLGSVCRASGQCLPLGPRPTLSVGAGQGELDVRWSAQVLERWVNGPEGLEQRFVLQRAPEGRGELVLSVKTSGMSYVAHTADGHHFRDDAAGLGMAYGQAFALLEGRREALEVRRTADALELHVPAAVLASARFPLEIDPMVTPETQVGARLLGNEGEEQRFPAIAASSNDYLVVWEDHRTGQPGSQIWGTRLDSSGRVLDKVGLQFAAAAEPGAAPAVAFDGTYYLAVWRQSVGIFGSRIQHSGLALDLNPALGISPSAGLGAQDVAVACSPNTGCLVAWDDGRGTIQAVPLSLQPVVRVGPQRTLRGQANNIPAYANPSVTAAGNQFQLAWESHDPQAGDQIEWATLDLDAGLLLAVAVSDVGLGPERNLPGIAFDPGSSKTVVAWNEVGDGGGTGQLIAAEWIISPGTLIRTVVDPAAFTTRPAVSYLASEPLVSWESPPSGGQSLKSRWGASGPTQSHNGTNSFTRLRPASATGPSADGGQQAIIVWQKASAAGTDIYASQFAPLSATAALPGANPLRVSQSANTQSSPSVGFDGTNFVVVWRDWRNAFQVDLYGTRVSPRGQVLDDGGLPICVGAGTRDEPRVASGGNQVLVVWTDRREGQVGSRIFGARVANGQVLPADGGRLMGNQSLSAHSPAVAADQGNFLVAWHEPPTALAPDGLKVSEVNSSGVPQNTPRAIPMAGTGTIEQREVDVVSTDGDFLVAWVEGRTRAVASLDDPLFVAQVQQSGSASAPVPVGASPGFHGHPALAFSGQGAAIAYYERLPAGSGTAIMANAITNGGGKPAVSAVAVALHPPSTTLQPLSPLAVAYDGIYYDVLWQEGQTLGGALVPSTGPAVPIFPQVANQPGEHPSLAAGLLKGTERAVVLAYDRYDSSDSMQTHRVFVRAVTFLDAGAGCVNDADCASGMCSNGVCVPPSRPLGAPCQTNAQCSTSICASGVCCSKPCDGPCLTCASAAAGPGECVPLPTGFSCSDGQICNGDERCDVQGVCQPGAQVVCDGGLVCSDEAQGCVAAPPLITSKPDSDAGCGAQYRYRPTASGGLPMTWSLADGGPPGLTVDPATGTVRWTPSVETSGAFNIELSAANDAGQASQPVLIEVHCVDQLNFTAAPCGCGAGEGSALLGLMMLLSRLPRRRR